MLCGIAFDILNGAIYPTRLSNEESATQSSNGIDPIARQVNPLTLVQVYGFASRHPNLGVIFSI